MSAHLLNFDAEFHSRYLQDLPLLAQLSVLYSLVMESTTTSSLFAVRTVFCCVVLALFLAVFSARKPKSNLPWVALDEDPTTKGLQNVGKARRQWVEDCNAVIDKGLREVGHVIWQQPYHYSLLLRTVELTTVYR
jgi:hypothetical protein